MYSKECMSKVEKIEIGKPEVQNYKAIVYTRNPTKKVATEG